jgi:PQQ-dependent dehydrogenase (methanol/ethanol family)
MLTLVLTACIVNSSARAERSSAPAENEWPSYGRDYSEQRFSPLSEVNIHTIKRLGLAWYYEFDTDHGQEATPLMTDGVLYTSTAWSKVLALDAKSGRRLWSFDPEVKRSRAGEFCCGVVNRGVALWKDRVYVGTLDGQLIALDAKTGKPVWRVDTVDQSKPYSITGTPRVFNGKVLIGNAGADLGCRGYISAYDAASGKQLWRFFVVPNPDGRLDGAASDQVLKAKAMQTWFGDGWKHTGGGGAVWDAIAYDSDTDRVYFGTGNGSPANRLERSDGKGDNLFVASIVAVRGDTGEYVWHYQTTPGDTWDFDATQPLVLADLMIGGESRKVLMQANKNGFYYVLDRLTGKLISAKQFVNITWATDVDMKTGRPVEIPGARYEKAPSSLTPSFDGAHSWHSMAFSPQTGLVYIPVMNDGATFTRDDHYRYRPRRLNPGFALDDIMLPTDKEVLKAIKASNNGSLVAWDPVNQEARWVVKRTYYINGGTLATAGGLVFQGTTEGVFFAYDAADGRELWAYRTHNGIIAAPMSYAIDGKQYIAILVGYGGPAALAGSGTTLPAQSRLPGRLLVFKLDSATQAPAYNAVAPKPPLDLSNVASSGNATNGMHLYNYTCLQCHGPSGSSNYAAELRRSPIITSSQAFQSVVLDGALEERGMVSFADTLTPDKLEDIRAFLLQEACKAAPACAARK